MTIETLINALEMDYLALAIGAEDGGIWPPILRLDMRSERGISSGIGIPSTFPEFCGQPGTMRRHVAGNRSKYHEVHDKCSVVSVRERYSPSIRADTSADVVGGNGMMPSSTKTLGLLTASTMSTGREERQSGTQD